MEDTHHTALEERTAAHQKAIDELKSSHSKTIEQRRSAYSKAQGEQRLEHEAQLRTMMANHARKLSALKESHAKKLSELDESHAKALTSQEQELRNYANLRPGQCAADVELVEECLGDIKSGGALRQALEAIQQPAYFSREVRDGLYGLARRLNIPSKQVFDPQLQEALAKLVSSFAAYWGPLNEKLDAPQGREALAWDMEVMQPDGMHWEGKTHHERWQSWKAFVDSLPELRRQFLDQVDAVEAILHALRVEATV